MGRVEVNRLRDAFRGPDLGASWSSIRRAWNHRAITIHGQFSRNWGRSGRRHGTAATSEASNYYPVNGGRWPARVIPGRCAAPNDVHAQKWPANRPLTESALTLC